jgi:hypothetical protein
MARPLLERPEQSEGLAGAGYGERPERRKSGVFDAGSGYDTSPLKGCCTATLVAV